MDRRFRLLALALPLLLALACSGGDSPTETSGLASLRGQIHLAPTGPAIGDASVLVQGRTTRSAGDGTFAVADLTPGFTTVTLSRSGFRTAVLHLTLTPGDNQFSLAMEAEP